MARPLMYFVCTGNSCRSQMAEGFARAMAGDRFEVASGGVEPSSLDARAVAVMGEVGIDISGHTSKGISDALLHRADVVVTLCGDANERCPAVPGARLRLHWDLPDPAHALGTEEERMAVFRSVRDEIGRRVRQLTAAPPGGAASTSAPDPAPAARSGVAGEGPDAAPAPDRTE